MNNLDAHDYKNSSTRLKELVSEIGIPIVKLQNVLSLKSEDCLRWWSDPKFNLKINESHFTRLSEMVAIDESALFSGQYDKNLARKRFLGDLSALPDCYLENPNSFLRTSAHIIRYIELTRGQLFTDQILYKLNVSPLIYQDLNTRVNLNYFADLLDVIEKSGFSQNELDTLASVMFLSLRKLPLGQLFESSQNHFDIYKTLDKNYEFFDSNFECKGQFIGNKYIVKTILPLDLHGQLKSSPEKIQRLMRYRYILSSWFPNLAAMTPCYPKLDQNLKACFVASSYEFDLTPKTTQRKMFSVV